MITLKTKRIIIRDHIIEDLQSHHQLLSDNEVMYYLQDIQTKFFEESRENLRIVIAEINSEKRTLMFFKMIDKETDTHIGEIGYTINDLTSNGKLVHLGYFTHKKFWNKGYVTEALNEIIRFAFEDEGVYKISTGCLVENIASERVMQKCGFIKDAGYSELENHEGELKSRVKYTLQKSDKLLSNG